jgi:D-alanine-D-alanine ligase
VRVALLHDALGEDASPDALDGLVQVEAVEAALAGRGHACERIAVGLDLGGLARTLRSRAPDLVFNLVEGPEGEARLAHVVTALLEVSGLPFTGSGSSAYFTTSHKLVAKRLLRAAGLPTADWLDPGQGPTAGAAPHRILEPRWILKPVWEDASVGIDDASLVSGGPEEVRRQLLLREGLVGRELFAEAYLEGRELNLSLLEKEGGLEVLPAAEILFRGYVPGKPRIVGYAAKWDPSSFEYQNTPRSFEFAPDQAPLLARIEELGRECWWLFGLAGYARVDFRVDEAGEPWILELNANPCLAPDAGFLAAAQRAGLEPGEVVARIARAGLYRGGPRRS